MSILKNKYANPARGGAFSGIAMLLGWLTVVALPVFANQPINSQTQSFELRLGSSRLVYNSEAKSASLEVLNEQDYPILVRGQVFAEDKISPARFMVTPPVFRLDAKQQSRLRVVRTGEQIPADREALYWLCVTGIPPKSDDAWADNKSSPPRQVNVTVRVSIKNCIKLLVRPPSIGPLADKAGLLKWTMVGDMLKANNPTPFYINLRQVMVDGQQTEKPEYVAPFSSRSFSLPNKLILPKAGAKIEWRATTDLGIESKLYQAKLP